MDTPQPISAEAREEIIQKYLVTPEGRGKLIAATLRPAEDVMIHVTNDPTLVERADSMIAEMERFQGYLTGKEEYDRRKFSSLLEGLKMLSEEIHGKKVVKRL